MKHELQKFFADLAADAVHIKRGYFKFTWTLAFMLSAGLLYSQTPLLNEIQKIVPEDGQTSDRFGSEVAISGATGMIGAPNNSEFGVEAGAVYLYNFEEGSWVFQEKLGDADPADHDRFGQNLALEGANLVVGVDQDDDNGNASGKVTLHQFDGNSWGFQDKITLSNPAEIDRFGFDVGISGSKLVVGAPYKNNFSGAAYIYNINADGTATQEATITPWDIARSDLYGNSVAISGNSAFVGSPSDDDRGINSGTVYVFQNGTTWSQSQKLIPSDNKESDEFGTSIAVSGEKAIIGAPGAGPGYLSGSAYIYSFVDNIWTQEAQLTASDAAANNRFGSAVSISGDFVLVGARGSRSAYVFIFDGTEWVETFKLLPSDGEIQDEFGLSLSIDGTKIFVGAPGKNNNRGAVYVFSTDTEAPVITASDITVDTDPNRCETELSVAELIVLGGVTAEDDVDGPMSPVLSVSGNEITSSVAFPLGSTQVDISATDASGNQAWETMFVVVEDNSPPSFLPVDDLLRSPDPKVDGATIIYELPVATDNCAIDGAPSLIAGLPSGAFFPIGITTVTYEVSDLSGNVSTTSFTVTITNDLGIVSFELIPVGKQKKQKKPKKGEVPSIPNAISPLESGDIIDLADEATSAFSIAANTNRKAGSVVFYLNGAPVRADNDAPLSLSGDKKQVTAFEIGPGDYTLQAIPYTKADGTGEEGFPLTVTFTVIDSSLPLARNGNNGSMAQALGNTIPEILQSSVYPNPSIGDVTLEIVSPRAETVQISLVDLSGRVWSRNSVALQQGRNSIEVSMLEANAPAGVLLLTIEGSTHEPIIHRLIRKD